MGVITFDRDVTNIGNEAFYECRDLKSLVIPNSVTCIGYDAFSRCENLRAVTIPSSVTSIEWDAFEECRSLRNITIPSSVTYIDGHAFHLCGLTSINIPSSVANIGYGAFSGCNGLTSICVSPDNKAYDSRDNCNAIINSQTNELIAGCKNTVIPNSVTSIGEEAFYYCEDLTSITIPNGVTSIGESAFDACYGLSSIVLPESVTSIGYRAFLSCRGLKDVYCMSKIVPSLGHGAFSDCPEATLHVPSGTKSLYEAADGWKDFGTIVEMEPDITDISAFPNILYTEQQEVFTGHEAILSIKLKNEASITAFQFDLQLPDGITVAKDSNGKNQISLDASRKADDHTISTNVLEDGTIRVACLSLSSEPFSGNDGTVVNVTIDIPDGMTNGDYNLILKNIEMTAPDNQAYKVELCKSTLTVSSYIPGDVNGDREITISDAVGVVNFVLKAYTEGLNENAADANQDGSISITDAVYVVNMVIHADETNVKGELKETTPSSLALRPLNVVAGEAFEMPVFLNGTANSITAMQFDLTLPEGITLSGIKTDEEHTVAYQEQEDGTIRVASLSVDNSTYSGNGDKSVILLLEAAPGFQEGVVIINNSELVTPGLRASHSEFVSALICGNATGIDGLRSTEDTDIYDLQGRKAQHASHGIYIQNGKKTAVK